MAKRPSSRSKAAETAAPAAAKTPRARAERRPKPSVDDIRRRAYERFLERGGKHGQHFDDWLEAERELKNRK